MEHWTERLSEYLDGELSTADRKTADLHLADCASCAALLSELREVAERASVLPSAPPEVDLWPAIASRLTPHRVPWWQRNTGGVQDGGRRYSFSFPQLAAAAAAIVLITGAVTWKLIQRPSDPIATERGVVSSPGVVRSPGAQPIATGPLASGRTPSERRVYSPEAERAPEGVQAGFNVHQYDQAVAELQRVLDEHRAELDTTTVRILEQNLALIDRATEEARRALAADPANPYLNGHLADQMMRKIRLLQRAADVVTAHS